VRRRTFLYNPQTCQYEPVYLTGSKLMRQLGIFFSFSLVVAIGLFFWYINRFAPIEEQRLTVENYTLRAEWKTLEERIANANHNLDELISQDDHNYRVILDLQPLSSTERDAGTGGAVPPYLAEVEEYDLIVDTYRRFEKLKHQLDVEQQSYEELNKTADRKLAMWASRPAIQPIDNKDLTRLHTIFGMRFHPILGYVRPHKGLDFTAPIGTPVYATGDGRVDNSYYSPTYGNVVYLNHGFDFETRYAHLTKYVVQPGEKVKRGQIIGYVGNTGTSVSAHLHYEVLFKNDHINPINFFQRDLSNQEYEKLIVQGEKEIISLD
jgi:murein DD-endopeptidase MepM/ murein hydrolase activator NlpD